MTLDLGTCVRTALPGLLAACALLSGYASAADTQVDNPYSFCNNWAEKAEPISPDFLHFFPGEGNWLFTDRDFSPVPSLTDKDVGELRKVVSALTARNIKTMIVVAPVRGLVSSGSAGPLRKRFARSEDDAIRRSYHAAIKQLASTGAVVPDLLSAVEAANLPASNHFYRSQDTHWRAEGARFSAKVVADAARKMIDLSKYPKQRFVTKMTGTETYNVKVLDAVDSICKTKPEREIEPRYVTEPVGDSSGSVDLLGGSQVPIVLVGTSFSRPDAAFNFPGFLSEQLEVDILNAAVPGGGLRTSILSYLGSKDFAESPPALLIWEVRPFDLPTADFSEQLLATMVGSCPVQQALLSSSVPLQRGVTPLITLDPKQRSTLKGPLYVDIAAGDTGLIKYTLRLTYTDFTQDEVEIDMTRATFAPDHYFHPLPAERLKSLDSVSLRPAARSTGKVTVSVCPISRAS